MKINYYFWSKYSNIISLKKSRPNYYLWFSFELRYILWFNLQFFQRKQIDEYFPDMINNFLIHKFLNLNNFIILYSYWLVEIFPISKSYFILFIFWKMIEYYFSKKTQKINHLKSIRWIPQEKEFIKTISKKVIFCSENIKNDMKKMNFNVF